MNYINNNLIILLKKNYSLLITFLFFLISFFLIGKHEMWRDEIQAWLIARDSSDLFSLFENLKYEGHPGLWHLILFCLTRITHNPYYMQILHVLISSCSIFILCHWSPFNKIQKLLLTFSYFFFYEYSIISRSYGLSTLLIFIFCTLFENRKKNSLKIAWTLFLLSHTNIFGFLMALSLFITTLLEDFISFFIKNSSFKGLFKKNQYISIIISISGFITALIQLSPPIDSPIVNTKINFPLHFYDLVFVFRNTLKAYMPIPNFKYDFWGTSLLNISFVLEIIFILLFIISFLIFINYLKRRPSSIFLYLFSSIILSTFFLLKLNDFYGSQRHFGFLFLSLLSSLWIYKFCILGSKKRKNIFYDKSLNFTINILFSIQAFAGIVAATYDYIFPFSSAKETANFLKTLDVSNSKIIAFKDAPGSAILGYLQNKKSFYYLEKKGEGSFIRWNNFRERKIDNETFKETVIKLSSNGNNLILISNSPLNEMGLFDDKFHNIFISKDAIVNDEKYFIYLYKKF